MPSSFDPEQVLHSWPLHERARGLEQGRVVRCGTSELVELALREAFGRKSAGWWQYDLAGDTLTWTAGVYQIFGLPIGARITRSEALSVYTEQSRVKMEELRSYALTEGVGFAIDAQIQPADGAPSRWMRLLASTVVEDGRVVRLYGLKFIL